VATVEECAAALERLSASMGGADETARGAMANRSVSCRLSDLDVTFSGHLRDGRIQGMTTAPAARADIRLTTTSDDLIELVDGRLPFAQAWSKGRVKVEASIRDLLRLRSLL